jgi:hypothetical protein
MWKKNSLIIRNGCNVHSIPRIRNSSNPSTVNPTGVNPLRKRIDVMECVKNVARVRVPQNDLSIP